MIFHSLADRLGGWCNGKRDHLAFGGSQFNPRLNQNQRLYLDKSVLQLMTMTPPRSRFGKSWFDIGQVNSISVRSTLRLCKWTFRSSSFNAQKQGVKAVTGLLGIRIICPSGPTCFCTIVIVLKQYLSINLSVGLVQSRHH